MYSVRNKNGQSAIEFLILVGGVVFFAIMFLSLVQMNISEDVREQRDIMVKEVAFIVQDEIVLAHNSIDGYSRNFTLPKTIAGAKYTVKVNPGWINVVTEDERHAAGFPILNVTVGKELEPGEKTLIRKSNGIVYLN